MITLIVLYVTLIGCAVYTAPISFQYKLENPAVVRLREYIQIDTSTGEDLQNAVEFWQRQADEFGLQFAVYKPAGIPICVLTWPGADSSLPSIMLNSHMDVVPAVDSDWTYPPFAADVDECGNIYGRGTQDTKDVSIQYLEAVGKLKRNNVTLQRTIHITLMPDEEIGGFQGMQAFVASPEFEALNVGFALDEGMANEGDNLYAGYQDKRPLQMNFTVEGVGGHGFTMPEDTAILKLNRLLDVMLEYRKPLQEALESKSASEYGLYTTFNINMINGGSAPNVIPSELNVVTDMRLSPKDNVTEILSMINSWVAHAGANTKVEFIRRELESAATPVDETNPYWVAMNETINELGYQLTPVVAPATSDMLYVRNRGVPAIGFAPKPRTKPRLHAADEYANIDIFLQGIDIYISLILKLGNLPRN